ncbi:hypothetical protein [Pseudomonas lurida]|uniref:hypothetical protein n=1 Tax=Pseudomonas lurida TaxID=244566 RepID=UPI0034D95999
MKVARLLAISLMTSTLAVTAQAATLKIETLPSNVTLMTAGLKENGVPRGGEYSQDFSDSDQTSITISPAAFTSTDQDSRPSIFGMLTIIVDPKATKGPMTYVACSGFSKTDIPYAVDIQVADKTIRCEPSSPPKGGNVKVDNVTSDIAIRLVNTAP